MQGLCRIFASNLTQCNARIINEIQRECRVLCRVCRVFCSARFTYIDFAPSAGNRQRAQDNEQWSFTVFFTDFTKNRVRNADKQGEFVNLPKFYTTLALISPPPHRLGVSFIASASPWRAFHRHRAAAMVEFHHHRVAAMVEFHRLCRSLDQSLLPRIVRTERIQRHSFDVS